MNTQTRKSAFLSLALAGVPVVFAVFVAIACQISPTPFYSPTGEAVLFTVTAASVITGGTLLALLTARWWQRFLFFALYAVPMVGVLFLVGLFVACFNGDCI